jgi:hypothetical protein
MLVRQVSKGSRNDQIFLSLGLTSGYQGLCGIEANAINKKPPSSLLVKLQTETEALVAGAMGRGDMARQQTWRPIFDVGGDLRSAEQMVCRP